MKWTLLQGGLLFLLCDLLTVVGAEKNFEGLATRGEKIPPHALRHLAAPTATTHNRGRSTGGPEERVQLPTQDCSHDADCLSYSSSLDIGCINGVCGCRPPLCWVYQYIITGTWTAKNEFTCGECGILGSSCNATILCKYPGECWSDGYCHCPSGENYDGVCLTSNLTWTNTLAFTAMGIVFFIATCIMAVNCYKQPPWRNSEAWRCRCCKAVSGRQRRRGSCEKTPAFTIQAHYASQELTSPQEEVQGASTYGAGGAVPRRPRPPSASSGTISSISSVNTNTTTVSGSVSGDSAARTSPPPPPPPPPPPSLSSPSNPILPSPLTPSPSTSLLPSISSSSAASALLHTPSSPTAPPPPYEPLPPAPSSSRDVMGDRDGDGSNIQLTEVLPGASSLPPSTPKPSSEVPSASSGVSGGCTHERCQLCLPKPPVSPVSAPPRRKTLERPNLNGKSPLLLRTEKLDAENAIELTQL